MKEEMVWARSTYEEDKILPIFFPPKLDGNRLLLTCELSAESFQRLSVTNHQTLKMP
jgi:hypothetical protein